ncbi:MAG: asparaginase domain-containing protein [Syntrophobacterales bacterium]|jgi:L-asparaginase
MKKMSKIKVFTVGGTIDKVYFDKKSKYEVGDPRVGEILKEANVTFDYDCESILKKDSLDMTDDDRQLIFDKIESEPNQHILVTHGTDTIIQTAKTLQPIQNKVIVLTGAVEPARSKSSDAPFNIGAAIAAVQFLPPGVYIVMNGRIFYPDRVVKDMDLNRFKES